MPKAKIKDGQETVITREQYNAIRKMDRAEAETFLQIIYKRGYDKGHSNGYKEADKSGFEKFKTAALSFFESIPGIGPATTKKILAALKGWCLEE